MLIQIGYLRKAALSQKLLCQVAPQQVEVIQSPKALRVLRNFKS